MSQAGILGTSINPSDFVQVIDGNTGSATPVGGIVNIVGSGNIDTTGVGDTLTITLVGTTDHAVQVGNAAGSLTSIPVGLTGQVLTGVTGGDPVFAAPAASAISITGDTGGALGPSNAFTFTGGTTGLLFNGAGTTETLGGTLIVSNGGTGRSTLTDHGLLVGAGTTAITQLAAAADGQLPIGSTGVDPVLATLTAGTGISIANGAGSITISSSGTTTLTYTNVNTSPYVVLATDEYLGVDASVAPITLQFPNAPAAGRVFIVKDFGGFAATNNITITSLGGAVGFDGALSYVMNTNLQAVQLLFDGTNYQIF